MVTKEFPSTYPVPNKPYCIETDAINYHMGYGIKQEVHSFALFLTDAARHPDKLHHKRESKTIHSRIYQIILFNALCIPYYHLHLS